MNWYKKAQNKISIEDILRILNIAYRFNSSYGRESYEIKRDDIINAFPNKNENEAYAELIKELKNMGWNAFYSLKTDDYFILEPL
jgi:hypothetical protein